MEAITLRDLEEGILGNSFSLSCKVEDRAGGVPVFMALK